MTWPITGSTGLGSENSRNSHSKKRILTESSSVEVAVPRDRSGSFEPQLVKKGQSRLPGFEAKVISLYARGMIQREIRTHFEEFYGISVSADLISRVTDAVIDEVKAWQTRPLDQIYPVIFFDALFVKVRDEGTVRNKAVYLAIGITMGGTKEILGLWIEQTEGAKFWLRVMNELRTRGIKDRLIAVVDGLKGFPQATNSVFPETQVQTCIVHLMRHGLSLCSFKDHREVAKGMKTIYRAEAAANRLTEFEQFWAAKYPSIAAGWRRNWEEIIPMFAFPPEIRLLIHTTNVMESLNRGLRKIIKTRGHFPNDQAATKLLFLALKNIEKRWKAAPQTHSTAQLRRGAQQDSHIGHSDA
ncbi:IS256 family transposase [Pelagibius litoralis]|uniref:Mutator family transposase n=1 Tax=Pelagibius litoralis TaxID=374515 RepID=A0A967KDX6_9PROT|nr:IS256 family transposase [Pelagibius litoralis]